MCYRGVQREEPSEPESERGAGTDRAGIRQPPRGTLQNQAAPTHPEGFQGTYYSLFPSLNH